jgi:thioredoxin reductase (NADPH)
MNKEKYKKIYKKYKNQYVDLKRAINITYDYDLIIIGGGSAGIASAVAASKYNIKIALFNYVHKTPQGTHWGLGGTCVNVGCIPKKLYYHAANVGELIHQEAKEFGWKINNTIENSWITLKNNIQEYVKSLNREYEISLKKNKIDYFNMFSRFIDSHKIEATDSDGNSKYFTTDKFIIATGGKPKYPNIPGAKEFGITSDDLFSLENNPGTTLIVGGSYIALECASFLKQLGCSVTILVRTSFLRKFDQEMIEILLSNLNLTYIKGAIPLKIELLNDTVKRIYYKTDMKEDNYLDVNTIVWAIGRESQIENLGLENAGVEFKEKILTKNEQTNIENIYAVGDVISGAVELTPVAIMSSKLLIERIFNSGTEFMDYNAVPTTVFTSPIEYASFGLTEENAIEMYGLDSIEVYHSYMDPLEYNMIHKTNVCYVKLICNKKENERIVGLHLVAPNAGEIIQGYVVAINMGAVKKDFDMTIGIHPTLSENILNLNITKSSGVSPNKKKC